MSECSDATPTPQCHKEGSRAVRQWMGGRLMVAKSKILPKDILLQLVNRGFAGNIE